MGLRIGAISPRIPENLAPRGGLTAFFGEDEALSWARAQGNHAARFDGYT
jgi:hypothetical protein